MLQMKTRTQRGEGLLAGELSWGWNLVCLTVKPISSAPHCLPVCPHMPQTKGNLRSFRMEKIVLGVLSISL